MTHIVGDQFVAKIILRFAQDGLYGPYAGFPDFSQVHMVVGRPHEEWVRFQNSLVPPALRFS